MIDLALLFARIMADGDVFGIAALVAVGGLAIAIIKVYLDVRAERNRSGMDAARLGLDKEQVTNIQRIAKSQADQVNQLRKLVESLTKVVASYETEVASLRREVESLRRASKGAETSQQALVEIERQKLAERQREAEWRKTRDLAKGLGWLLDHLSTNEGEEDDGG